MSDTKLVTLVNALPEFYQPIYAHNEWDNRPLRHCKDRLVVVKKIYNELSRELQRPLRVLDLGCAQGFFSLHLASWGGNITGIDFSEQNISLCKFLASEHPDYNANFIRAKIEDFLPAVKVEEYDLVLCLSILHNISKYLGVENIRKLMSDLSQKIDGGIFEFALESVHRKYIPRDYRDFLPNFAFIKELAQSKSRDINGAKRPLCFASNKYVYFENFGMLKIDEISYNVHSYLRKEDLIHFHCGDKFIKFFYITNEGQLVKAQQEIQFLKELGGQRGLPKLLATYAEQDQNGIRLFIVREKLEGIVLSEKLASDKKINTWDVLKQALQWMVFFEQHDYYHGDIQTPNFIYSPDGKLYPIDYEEIRHAPIVLIWPYKVNLLFLIFMNALLDRRCEKSGFHREARLLTNLKKHLSSKQYEQISKITESEKFFARLYEILFQTSNQSLEKESYKIGELEILSVEKFLDDVSWRLKEHQNALEQINNLTLEINSFANSVIKLLVEQQKRIEKLEKLLSERN